MMPPAWPRGVWDELSAWVRPIESVTLEKWGVEEDAGPVYIQWASGCIDFCAGTSTTPPQAPPTPPKNPLPSCCQISGETINLVPRPHQSNRPSMQLLNPHLICAWTTHMLNPHHGGLSSLADIDFRHQLHWRTYTQHLFHIYTLSIDSLILAV